jgi:NAD-dependent SIR2 family protein deacetylase
LEPKENFDLIKDLVTLPQIEDYYIVTSNIDCLFQKAGFPDEKI